MNLSINLEKFKKKLVSFFYLLKIGTLKMKLILISLRELSKNKKELNQVHKEKNKLIFF